MRKNKEAKVTMLRKIMEAGHWRNEKELMRDTLTISPNKFERLSDRDIDSCIARANAKLMYNGVEPVKPEPENDEGRCLDIWEDDAQSKDASRAFKWGRVKPNKFKPTPGKVWTSTSGDWESFRTDEIDWEAIELAQDKIKSSEEIKFNNEYLAVPSLAERELPKDQLEKSTRINWSGTLKWDGKPIEAVESSKKT